MLADVPLTTNALVLLAVLALSSAAWLVLRRRDGAFRSVGRGATADAATGGAAPADEGAAHRVTTGDLGLPHESWHAAAAVGAVGSRATFVQVSSEGCATCPQVARMLSGLVADGVVGHGVVHVEVDAAERLDLVRRLGIMRTPTVLLLDGDGRLVSRTSGTVRADQARAALAQIAGDAHSHSRADADADADDMVATGVLR